MSKRTAKKPTLAKVASIGDLFARARTDERYAALAHCAARNLGGERLSTLEDARRWLETNAMETDEAGVVDEINFCRDLV